MSIAGIVRALVAAGATPEMILAAVEAAEAHGASEIASRRAKDAERQRRYRERHVTSRDVTVTERDTPLTGPPLPPTPPNSPPISPQHTHQGASAQAHHEPASGDYPPGSFEAFWSAYPEKIGKRAAAAKFDTIRRSGKVAFSEIMAGLDRYKRTKPADRDWCHPTTWLNQGRWADETPAAKAPAAAAPDSDAERAKWRAFMARYGIDRDTKPDIARRADWGDILAVWFGYGTWIPSTPDPRSSQCPIPVEDVERYQTKFGWVAPKVRAVERGAA